MKKLIPWLVFCFCLRTLPAQTIIYSTTDFSGWLLGAKPTIAGGNLTTASSSANAAFDYFETPGNQYTMTVGETLTLAANFTMASGSSINSSRSFYFTLQNSNSTLSSNNQLSANLSSNTTDASFANFTGYGLLINPGPASASAGQFDARTAANTNIVAQSTPWTLPGGIAALSSGTFSLTTANEYRISYTIKEVSASAVDFSYTMTNLTSTATLYTGSASATGLSGSSFVNRFDTIALGVTNTQTGSYQFHDLSLTSSLNPVPEPAVYAELFGLFSLAGAAWHRRAPCIPSKK